MGLTGLSFKEEMMQILFALTFNTETKEASMAGTIPAQQALQILQQLVIADAINKAIALAKAKEELPNAG